MTTSTGGGAVGAGWWLDTRTLQVRQVPEGGALPGAGGRWVRLSGWWLVPAAPLLGGLFVVALPVAGAALAAWALVRLAAGRLAGHAAGLGATVATGLRPGESHLSGGAPEERPPGHDPELDELDELGREVAARRARQR